MRRLRPAALLLVGCAGLAVGCGAGPPATAPASLAPAVPSGVLLYGGARRPATSLARAGELLRQLGLDTNLTDLAERHLAGAGYPVDLGRDWHFVVLSHDSGRLGTVVLAPVARPAADRGWHDADLAGVRVTVRPLRADVLVFTDSPEQADALAPFLHALADEPAEADLDARLPVGRMLQSDATDRGLPIPGVTSGERWLDERLRGLLRQLDELRLTADVGPHDVTLHLRARAQAGSALGRDVLGARPLSPATLAGVPPSAAIILAGRVSADTWLALDRALRAGEHRPIDPATPDLRRRVAQALGGEQLLAADLTADAEGIPTPTLLGVLRPTAPAALVEALRGGRLLPPLFDVDGVPVATLPSVRPDGLPLLVASPGDRVLLALGARAEALLREALGPHQGRAAQGPRATLQRAAPGAFLLASVDAVDVLHRWVGGAPPEHSERGPPIELSVGAEGETLLARLNLPADQLAAAFGLAVRWLLPVPARSPAEEGLEI